MAWSERTTTVANPATRKRRKVKNVARRLTLKQKLHFGSKAQRAAARRALSGARKRKRNTAHRKRTNPGGKRVIAGYGSTTMNRARRRKRRNPPKGGGRVITGYGSTVMNRARKRKRKNAAGGTKKVYIINPARRRKKKNSAKRRRNSPGGIIAMTLAPLGNPARRRKKAVATSKRRRKANASRRRKANAGRPRRRANRAVRHHRRRSNPGKMGNLVMQAVGVAGGAVGSKLLTQMVLGANNTSITGYAGNLIAGGILAYATKLATKSQELAAAVMVGAVTQVALRLITDLTPFGSVVSGTGLGDYQISNFWNPQRLNSPKTATFNQNWMGGGSPAMVTATAPVTSALPGVAPASSGSMW